jgi:uncharacterized protein (DUF1499 family)
MWDNQMYFYNSIEILKFITVFTFVNDIDFSLPFDNSNWQVKSIY